MSNEMRGAPTEGELTEALALGLTEVLRLVRFSTVEEFLEELDKQRRELQLPYVHLTASFRRWDCLRGR